MPGPLDRSVVFLFLSGSSMAVAWGLVPCRVTGEGSVLPGTCQGLRTERPCLACAHTHKHAHTLFLVVGGAAAGHVGLPDVMGAVGPLQGGRLPCQGPALVGSARPKGAWLPWVGRAAAAALKGYRSRRSAVSLFGERSAAGDGPSGGVGAAVRGSVLCRGTGRGRAPPPAHAGGCGPKSVLVPH